MTFARITKQLDRMERRANDLRDATDWYAGVIFNQGVKILMALSDSVQNLLAAVANERTELQSKFDTLKSLIAELQAQIAAGGDPALQAKIDELQGQVDELQGQLDAGAASIDEATAAVEALSDTGDDAAPPA